MQQVRPSRLHIPTRLHSFTYYKAFILIKKLLFSAVVDYSLGHLTACQSKEWVCARLPAEIVGSNPIGGMDVCLL